MDKEKEATIYDIARILNISPATVSRGLKDHSAISKKTRKRISDAAKELGYRSNLHAGNLRQGQGTNTIGVIIHWLNSNFITSVLAGIEKATTEAGYDLIIGHSSEKADKEAANAANFFQKRVDGLIASLANDTTDFSHFTPFIEKGIPLIFFDRVDESIPGTKVIIDNFRAAYEATEHLIQQGCRNIVHITSSQKRNVYAERLKGYKHALLINGLEYDPNKIIATNLTEDASIEAAQAILTMNPRPDGLFVVNDFCAAVCMHTLQEAGLKVPQDIAIIGFNNDSITKIMVPKLTTVDYPGKEIGEVAGRQLIMHLNNTGSNYNNTIVVPSKLIIRESSLRKG